MQPNLSSDCCRKMAELRALVAVKRVIDFAVKVTFPNPTLTQRPET